MCDENGDSSLQVGRCFQRSRLLPADLVAWFFWERITWHCQRVIHRICNRMEELGLGRFLQLVEEPPQSHQVQFVRSIFEEPGGKKQIFTWEQFHQVFAVE